jgi:hypothetical protein
MHEELDGDTGGIVNESGIEQSQEDADKEEAQRHPIADSVGCDDGINSPRRSLARPSLP